MGKLPILKSCNIDGGAVGAFTAHDQDASAVSLVLFHTECNESIDVHGIEEIKKFNDWLTTCIDIYEGRVSESSEKSSPRKNASAQTLVSIKGN